MKRALKLSLAISLALGAGHASAIGLGQIQVKSRLNQPLDAEIPVIVDRRGEAESLVVKLASAEEFSRIGIERSQIGVPLEFALGQSARGDTVIRVTSKEAVHAPFLDFLLEANWSNGRVLREYTVLLDPPLTAPASAASSVAAEPAPRAVVVPPPPPAAAAPAPVAAPVARAEPVRPAAAPRPPVPAAESEPASSSAPVAVASPAVRPAPAPRPSPPSERRLPPSVAASNGTNYGPVAEGETLWEIAQATLPDGGVSANQLMLALLKANPDAFVRNNINRLKRGAILRIPSGEEIRAVGSMRTAAAQVQSQIAEWRGETARPTLLAGSAAGTAPAWDKADRAKPGRGDDRLALVPPDLGKDGLASTGQAGSSAGAAGGNASAAELARANESLAARTQEAGELRTRVKDLESLQSKNERLISLKDSEIAELQRKLAAAQAAAATKTVEGTAKPVVEPVKPADIAVPASSPDSASPAPVPVTTKDDIWGTNASTTAVDPAKPDPATTATTPQDASPEAPTTSGPAASETDPLASPATETPSPVEPAVTGATALTAPETTADSQSPTPAENPPVTEAAQTTPAAPIQPAPAAVVADEGSPWYLDPRVLGGAGIVALLLGFLAVRSRGKGRKAAPRPSLADQFASGAAAIPVIPQAGDGAILNDEETQLADQIAFRPDDLGARLELLSIYYADNRVEEFRAAAAAMQAHVHDPREPEWVQVRAMGEDLLPDDPLFASATSESQPGRADMAAGRWHQEEVVVEDVDELRWADEEEPVAAAPPPPAPPAFDEQRYAPARNVEPVADLRSVEVEPAGVDHQAAYDNGLELSLDDFDDEPVAAESPAKPAAPAPAGQPLTEFASEKKKDDEAFGFDLPPLDFDMEFNKPQVANTPSLADEVPETDDEFFVGEDALGTKLDLARAYADMGDPDGARAMLEEVIAEGDSAQQEQARKLLVELG